MTPKTHVARFEDTESQSRYIPGGGLFLISISSFCNLLCQAAIFDALLWLPRYHTVAQKEWVLKYGISWQVAKKHDVLNMYRNSIKNAKNGNNNKNNTKCHENATFS